MRAIKGKVLVKMSTLQKEKYSFANGTTIHISRGFEFNRRLDYPSRAEVIDGEGLPTGADILVHHNAIEPSYWVEGEQILTDQEKQDGYKILSIPADMCFAYNNWDFKGWVPCKNFLITKRIFKPYKGLIHGVPHEQIKNRLYIVKGIDEWDGEVKDLSGKVCAVTLNSDYQVIYHNKENREESLIRTRWREIEAIDEGLTKELSKGELLVGHSPEDAKPLKELVYG